MVYECDVCGLIYPYRSHFSESLKETHCVCGWPKETQSEDESHSPLACATSDYATVTSSSHNDRVDGVYCYRVTMSPKGDICDDIIKWFLKTYKKCNKYVVCERGKNGQRHLHALIQFDQPKKKRMLQCTLARQMKIFHPDAVGKYAVVVNAAYNMIWADEYLSKEEGVEHVDTDKFDYDEFKRGLPDEATQEVLQSMQGRRPTGAYWADHEKRWCEYAPTDPSYDSACRYFQWRMFQARDMEPISDRRRLAQNAYTLHCYRNRSVEVDEGLREYYRKQTEQYIRGAP